jgi:tetratricopeptide (TPR) repeat protein
VETYRRAITLSEQAGFNASRDAALERQVAAAASRLCVTLLTRGDTQGALDVCRRSAAMFDALRPTQGGDSTFRQESAIADSWYGNALRVNGQYGPASERLESAASRLRGLAEAGPSNAGVRGDLARSLTHLASTYAALGDHGRAVPPYQEAAELTAELMRVDPQNQRWRSMLTFMLLRRSGTLVKAGRSREAAESSRRGLALLREQADRPNASRTDMNEYASWLLTCEPATLRNPAEALKYAQRASLGSSEPLYLDTLALAFFHNGDRAQAIATAERALASIAGAPGPSTGLRADIEGRLEMFRNASR